jgi:hypothetical protein
MDELSKLFEEVGLFVKQSAPLDKNGNLKIKYTVSSIDFLTDEVLENAILSAQSEISDFLKVRKVTVKSLSLFGQSRIFITSSNTSQSTLLTHLSSYCVKAEPHLHGVAIPVTSCKDLGALFEEAKKQIKDSFLNALEKAVKKHLITKETLFDEIYDHHSDSYKFTFEI